MAVQRRLALLLCLGWLTSACSGVAAEDLAPVEPDQLDAALQDRSFLNALGTDEFVILRQYPYRVVIETRHGPQRIWEMVYLADHGWRLKGEDEPLVLVPGRGYIRTPEG